MQVRHVTVEELLAQGRHLFTAHHAEFGENEPLAVNEGQFLSMQMLGVLISLGMFEGDKLVGYALGVVTAHQTLDQIVCSEFGLFVDAKHRHHGSGKQLMAALVAQAKERGASRVHWHAKRGHVFERLCQQRGAREAEVVYVEKV